MLKPKPRLLVPNEIFWQSVLTVEICNHVWVNLHLLYEFWRIFHWSTLWIFCKQVQPHPPLWFSLQNYDRRYMCKYICVYFFFYGHTYVGLSQLLMGGWVYAFASPDEGEGLHAHPPCSDLSCVHCMRLDISVSNAWCNRSVRVNL